MAFFGSGAVAANPRASTLRYVALASRARAPRWVVPTATVPVAYVLRSSARPPAFLGLRSRFQRLPIPVISVVGAYRVRSTSRPYALLAPRVRYQRLPIPPILAVPLDSGTAVIANPNWPALDIEADFTQGPPNLPGTSRRSINAAYRRLAVRQFGVDRGRQYELDQVQAGTFTAQTVDPLEYLNPDNTASPFNTGGNQVTPYRALWAWAMWPNQPGSGNIINTKVSTGYDPSFETGLSGWVSAGGTTTVVQSTAQALTGTKSLLVTQSAAGAAVGAANSTYRTVPGLTYTFSAYIFPTGGCSVTIQVADALGAVHSSAVASAQNMWTRLSLAWTAVDTLETVTIYGTVTGTPTFHVDATQLEFGAQLTIFGTTGPTLYPLFTGYAERWPTAYDMSGFRALHPLYGVDALAILSRTVVKQTYNDVVSADNPSVFLPLSNAIAPTSSGALSTGSETAVIGSSNIKGNPTFTVSPTGSISWAGDQHPDGTPAVVFTQQNANKPIGPGGSNQDTFMDIVSGSLSLDTVGGGVVEFWAKPVVGQMQLGSLYVQTAGGTSNYPSGIIQLNVQTFAGGYIGFLYNPTGSGGGFGGSKFTQDGQWHYFAQTVRSGAWDNTVDATEANFFISSVGNVGFTFQCHVSANTGFGDPVSQVSFGRWAFYPTNIGAARRLAHYRRGVGFIKELSGARVTRLLAKYWLGTTSIATGFLAMAPDHGYNGRVVLDVLQEIQESERGLVFVNAAGTVVYQDRSSRYTNQTALWVFGENPTGASPVEFPYTDYAADHDPTYTFSQANLSRPGSSNFAPIINTATQTKYGQRILSQTLQCTTDFDLTQAGIFYTQRYSAPTTRISKLTLKPASNPLLWPVILSLEISQRITVKRRNAGVTVSNDYYIEKLSHKVNGDAGEWVTELQVSPVFVPKAWILGDDTFGVLGTTTAPVY